MQAASAKAVPDQPVLSRKQYLQGACIGLIAGLASGYVGVGGGFIMVPLMLAVLGIPMSLASGTSLIAIMILAIPGVIEQGLLGNIEYLAGIAIVVGSIPGAWWARGWCAWCPSGSCGSSLAAFCWWRPSCSCSMNSVYWLTPHAGLIGLPVVPDKEGVGV